MAQLIFFNLPNENPLQGTEFKARKDGDVLYPIIPDDTDGKKLFICGKGWITIGKRNVVTVPVWDRQIETFNSYLEKYGTYCLYYSITGKSFQSRNCCDYNAQYEFASVCRYCHNRLEDYNKFVTLYRKFLELEREAVTDLYKNNGNPEWQIKFYLSHYSLRPTYSTMGILMPPDVQILKAEKYLSEFVIEKYNESLASDSKDYILDSWEDKAKSVCEVFKHRNIPQMVEYCYGKEAADLYSEIEKIFSETDF